MGLFRSNGDERKPDNLNSGNFIWVNLGKRLGFSDAETEKTVFQKLLDGGVYIVSLLNLASPTF